jgi:hypothetical protein
VCCNLGCWHCPHVDREAAVVFHWLRRERVFERDIFRFGTGTVRTSSQSLSNHWAAEGKYPLKRLNLEIGIIKSYAPKGSPTSVDNFVGVIVGQFCPFAPAIRA